MQVDSAVLRGVANRLRDEVMETLESACRAMDRTEDAADLGNSFDKYGSLNAYHAVAFAWGQEVLHLKEALGGIATALDKAAENYDRSDASASVRMADIR